MRSQKALKTKKKFFDVDHIEKEGNFRWFIKIGKIFSPEIIPNSRGILSKSISCDRAIMNKGYVKLILLKTDNF